MYDVVFQDSSEDFETVDACEAVHSAIVSAINGVEAIVLDGDEEVWQVEVGTKFDDSDASHPAIVHFRRFDRLAESDKPDKSRARDDSEPSSKARKWLG